MKKVVKMGSLFALAGATLLSSGCSCSLSKSKLDERTKEVYESSVAYDQNYTTEFTLVSKQEQSDGKVVVSQTYVKTTRDAQNDSFVFDVETKQGYEGEELQIVEEFTGNEKIYKDGSIVKLQKLNGTVVDLEQLSTVYAYRETVSLRADGLIILNYHEFGVGGYDKYKEIVYHGCSSSGDALAIPDIHVASVDSQLGKEESLSCEAKKKLFGKDATYTVKYRVSISEITEVVIKTNKDNDIVEVNQENKIAVAGENPIIENITYKISR